MSSILDSYGQIGGAASLLFGTAAASNPVTLALAGGMAGLSAYSSTQQADEELGFINEQISGLSDARKAMEENRLSELDIAKSHYSEGMGELSYATGQSLMDVMKQGEFVAGSTGLAYSGTVSENLESARGKIRKQFGFQQTGLENILGEKLMGIEERFGAQMGDLEAELEGLQYQRKQAKGRTGVGGFFKSFIGG